MLCKTHEQGYIYRNCMSYKCSIDVEYFLLQQFDYLPVCMSVFIYLSICLSIAMSLLQHLVTKSRKSRSAETILSEKVSQRTAKLHFVSGHTKLICPKTKEERVYVDSLTHLCDRYHWLENSSAHQVSSVGRLVHTACNIYAKWNCPQHCVST